jgi:hypothetical protein
MSLKVALSRKKAKSKRGCNLGSVKAAGNKVGGCEANARGAGNDIAVVRVTVAAGVDVVAFFVDFFLLDGAGIVFMS